MGIEAIRRKEFIKRVVTDRGGISVAETARKLDVSEVTVRRYLEELEKEGILIRTYGGAVKTQNNISAEFLFKKKTGRNLKEKRAIARTAFKFVNQGESIFIDAGTTTLELARCIRENRLKITVATTSLPIASELADTETVKLLLLGGFLRRELFDLFGPFTIGELKHLTCNQAFLGVDGISFRDGLTTTDSVTALIEETVMERSRVINILADHTKIGHVALIPYGNIKSMNKTRRLIIDRKVSSGEIRKLQKLGLKVVLAQGQP